jgi:hypothetical protein
MENIKKTIIDNKNNLMKHGIIQKNYCATEGDVRIDINELTSKKLIDKIFNVSKPRKSLNFMKAGNQNHVEHSCQILKNHA